MGEKNPKKPLKKKKVVEKTNQSRIMTETPSTLSPKKKEEPKKKK